LKTKQSYTCGAFGLFEFPNIEKQKKIYSETLQKKIQLFGACENDINGMHCYSSSVWFYSFFYFKKKIENEDLQKIIYIFVIGTSKRIHLMEIINLNHS
jgi:hypothetical protein